MSDDISEVVKELRERAGKILLLSWRDDVEVLLEAKELMAEMCVALPALLDALERRSPVVKEVELPSGRVSPAPTLEPCPHCNSGDSHVRLMDDDPNGPFYVKCWKCGARGGLWGDKERACWTWNRRSPSRNATIEECARVADEAGANIATYGDYTTFIIRLLADRIRSLASQPSPVGKGLEVMTPSGRGDGSDDISRLAAFAKDVIRLAWDAAVDGGDVQGAAERHGLIVLAPYDPAEHGDLVEADPGEEIFVFADWLKAIQKAIGGETRGEARQSSNSRMERMEEAAQIARDQVSDDPQPGTWNDACEHIANVIARLALDEEKAGG